MLRRLETVLLRAFTGVLRRLPFPLALGVGRLLGTAVYLLVGSSIGRRIDLRFPGQGRRLARAHLVHVGMSLCEFLRAPYCPQDLDGIEVTGLDHLPPAGGVLLAAHYGTFELLSWVLGRTGRKVASLAWHPYDVLFKLIDRHRRTSGLAFIYTSESAAARARAYLLATRLVEDQYIVVFLTDAGSSRGLEVEFLGRPSGFDLGGELVAQRTQTPVGGLFITRTPRGHHAEVVPLPAEAPTRAFVRLLEERVRAKPDQYAWVFPNVPPKA